MEIYAPTWKDNEGNHIGLQFLGNRSIQYVIFKNRAAEASFHELHARDTQKGIERQIPVFDLKPLLRYMTGDNLLPNKDQILAAIQRLRAATGDQHVDGSEFRLRPDRPEDTSVSLNWLEYYDGLDKEAQLALIRRVESLSRRKTSR